MCQGQPGMGWASSWRQDFWRVMETMHPDARRRFERQGPIYPLARALFIGAAMKLGLSIEYAAYILEQVHCAIVEAEG